MRTAIGQDFGRSQPEGALAVGVEEVAGMQP
jgi:hypothetical protein